MTEEQSYKIMSSFQPTIAWRDLGKEMGFDFMTVILDVKGDRFFSAEVVYPAYKVCPLCSMENTILFSYDSDHDGLTICRNCNTKLNVEKYE